MKRLTSLTAKSKNSGHAARRGMGGRGSKPPAASARSARRNVELERELAETRDYLQSIQDQHEAANQELQASNEEGQSANEELQSINEELETAKEELESSNEELATVNEEMVNRNAELSRLNSDLLNLETSTSLGIVLFARNLTIRRFSVRAQKQFNLMASDIGRPVRSVRHNFVFPDDCRSRDKDAHSSPAGQNLVTSAAASEPTDSLEPLLSEVMASAQERQCDVQDKDGRWYSLRARPYFTLDNKVDGAVLVVVDITDLKRTEREIKAARDYAEATVRTCADPLIVLRADMRVDTANEAFYKTFKVSPAETDGRLIYELGNCQWNVPRLRQFLAEIIACNKCFNDFEVTHDFPGIGRRTMLLNARKVDTPEGVPHRILLGMQDVTARLQAENDRRQLAAIVEYSSDAIIGKNLDGIITSWNRSAERVFGYSAREAIGREVAMLIPPGRRNEELEILERIRRGDSIEHYETVRLRKDASRLDVSLTVSPVKDAAGRVVGASKIARDVTAHKQAEEALRASEERFRTLFNLGPVAVYSIDTSGVIQNFNCRAAELLGRKPAVGDTAQRFFGSFKLFRPDGSYMPHDQSPMAEVVSGKISEARDVEIVIERPDGSRVTVVVNIQPLKDDRGEVTGAIKCFYDISGRKQAEQTLRESERRYRSLFESIDEGFCVIEVLFDSQQRAIDFVYLETNPAFEKQTGLHGVQGRRVLELAPALERRWFETYGRVVLTGEPVRFQDRAEVLGRWFDVYAFRVEAPELRRVAVLFTDITQHREAQDALHAAQEQLADHAEQLEQLVTDRTAKLQETIGELEHFSYTITHDMRAPLRAMKGFGGELLRESGSRLPPASADYLRRIMDSAERMDALIRDALQYTKIVRGDIPLTPVEPAPVLRGILESYPSLQPPQVDVQIIEPLPPVIANESGLGQCFSNLLANAVKFVKPGITPKIRIWAELPQDAPQQPDYASIHQCSSAAVVRFWFEDNGIGVPGEYQDRIFDMFQQLDKSYEGTGIGLALVRKTVERMKGKVGVESASDKGSRFWLEFQRADPIIPQSNNPAAA